MAMFILLVSGCKITIGGKDEVKKDDDNYAGVSGDESASGDAEKKEKSAAFNKNDIDKIEVSFSEKDGTYKRSVSIEPKDGKIQCSYQSSYLESPLTSELDQENYNMICKSISSFKEKNWTASDMKQYETDTYKPQNIGVCKVKIDSNLYAIDDASTNKNLCQALTCQVLNTVFPLKWDSTFNSDLDKYYNVYLGYYDRTSDDVINSYKYMNYTASPNYFMFNDSFRETLRDWSGIDIDTSKKYFELQYRLPGEEMNIGANSLSLQQPLEHEFFSLLSKVDVEKIMSNNENDSIKRKDDDTILESVYKLQLVDKQENKRISFIKKDTMPKLGQKEIFDEIYDWSSEITGQF